MWDRAYDSDPLDQQLAAQGIKLIAPYRKNRIRMATQDDRYSAATGVDRKLNVCLRK